MDIGFDNLAYMGKQTDQILHRVEKFNDKLYLEFGGKLFDDHHAARVLPGFAVDGKILLLEKLKENIEILICVSAVDIEKNKVRADLGITYDMESLRLIDNLRKRGLYVSSIVITQYQDQPTADMFKNRLERRGEKVYVHRLTKGYPTNVNLIVSDEGYGANSYIATERSLVVVTGPGPGSGKLATCLSQIYHDYKNGIKAGYAKFETFPVWNLPLNHPVNLAYEAATADLSDVNAIDPYHMEAFGKTAISYNRDIEAFPIVKTILAKIMGDTVYSSPTEMGVNRTGHCITSEDVVREAAKQEVIRRYFKTLCSYKNGQAELGAVEKLQNIMNRLGITPDYGLAVRPALEKAEQVKCPAMALILDGGEVITAKTSQALTAASGLVLNCVKHLAGISDDLHLISPVILEPMLLLKEKIFQDKNPLLCLEEVLNALSISAATSPVAEKCLYKLAELKNCVAHSSHMISKSDELTFLKLGIQVTCSPEFPSDDLYCV